MHESQSRLWENMVGRGRAFCGVLPRGSPSSPWSGSPRLGADDLFRAVNQVRPSFIRVEADEATYALHIILRFELEQALIDGTLTVEELPEAWNARFTEYLGLTVPNDAEGVLQDVHWSAGLIGYFPTYALGNLIAGQLWERAHAGGRRPRRPASPPASWRPLRDWLRPARSIATAPSSPPAELLERERRPHLGGSLMPSPRATCARTTSSRGGGARTRCRPRPERRAAVGGPGAWGEASRPGP